MTCGITFTFGGIGITEKGEVLDTSGNVINGLFAAGEITGGSFYQQLSGRLRSDEGRRLRPAGGHQRAAFAKAKRA